MPDVCHVTAEQLPGLCPVGGIVIPDLAELLLVVVNACLSAPGGVIVHAVGWIRNHEEWLFAVQEPCYVVGLGTVAAQKPVIAQQPKIATLGRRLFGRFGDFVFD